MDTGRGLRPREIAQGSSDPASLKQKPWPVTAPVTSGSCHPPPSPRPAPQNKAMAFATTQHQPGRQKARAGVPGPGPAPLRPPLGSSLRWGQPCLPASLLEAKDSLVCKGPACLAVLEEGFLFSLCWAWSGKVVASCPFLGVLTQEQEGGTGGRMQAGDPAGDPGPWAPWC